MCLEAALCTAVRGQTVLKWRIDLRLCTWGLSYSLLQLMSKSQVCMRAAHFAAILGWSGGHTVFLQGQSQTGTSLNDMNSLFVVKVFCLRHQEAESEQHRDAKGSVWTVTFFVTRRPVGCSEPISLVFYSTSLLRSHFEFLLCYSLTALLKSVALSLASNSSPQWDSCSSIVRGERKRL